MCCVHTNHPCAYTDDLHIKLSDALDRKWRLIEENWSDRGSDAES